MRVSFDVISLCSHQDTKTNANQYKSSDNVITPARIHARVVMTGRYIEW